MVILSSSFVGDINLHFFALGSSTADKLKERSEEDEDEELIFVSDRSFGGARFRGVEARKYLNTLGTTSSLRLADVGDR